MSLASISEGILASAFSMAAAGKMFTENGAICSIFNLLPSAPHFPGFVPSGAAIQAQALQNQSPMTVLLLQQQELQRQQQEFQNKQISTQLAQQSDTSKEQAGMVRDMLERMDRNFQSMVDLMDRMMGHMIDQSKLSVTDPQPPKGTGVLFERLVQSADNQNNENNSKVIWMKDRAS